MTSSDPRVDMLVASHIGADKWALLSESTRGELRPGFVDLLARLDRVERPSDATVDAIREVASRLDPLGDDDTMDASALRHNARRLRDIANRIREVSS